jgi:hypothetical protein
MISQAGHSPPNYWHSATVNSPMSAVVIAVVLLVFAASFGSWCLSQWLGARPHASNATLAMGGAGVALLIGAAALTFLVAPTSWYSLLQTVGMGADAPAGRVSPGFRTSSQDENVSGVRPTNESSAPESAGRARAYSVQETPGRPHQLTATRIVETTSRHTAVASTASREIDFIIADHWPATECVKSLRSDDSRRWLLDNECPGVVAIVFAWCSRPGPACDPNAPDSTAWRYEPAGILMTTLREPLSSRRLTEGGPLIAPTYAQRETADLPQIRYFACNVTDADLLAQLNEPDGAAAGGAKLDAALRADECYAWVAQLSRTGERTGKSPDVLLLSGRD